MGLEVFGFAVGARVMGLAVFGFVVGVRVVGLAVFGFAVGVGFVGLKVFGLSESNAVGFRVGARAVALVGCAVGEPVGCTVVGIDDGVGIRVGTLVGLADGELAGCTVVGLFVISLDDRFVIGVDVGRNNGVKVGVIVGDDDAVQKEGLNITMTKMVPTFCSNQFMYSLPSL